MEAVSALLRLIRLDSAIYFNAEFSEPWCLRSPEADSLAPLLAQTPAHVIIYHLLCDGQAWIEVNGERTALRAGDLVTFPHGHAHTLGSGDRALPIDARAALPGVLARGLELLQHGGGGPCCRFICGFLACDPDLTDTYLGGLPPLVTVNIRSDPSGLWLENSLQFAVLQAASREPGSDAVLARLAEVVFAETLRRYVRDLPPDQTGWLAGTRDPEVARVLALLHGRPAEPWTVASLAHEAGLSRTVLADRFRHVLGEGPIAYLTRWRLHLASRALTGTSRGVAQVAAEAGYESEAAFTRAFKRQFGLPPAQYRRERGAARSPAASRAAHV
jgi:AraC-like DNA-binding protein